MYLTTLLFATKKILFTIISVLRKKNHEVENLSCHYFSPLMHSLDKHFLLLPITKSISCPYLLYAIYIQDVRKKRYKVCKKETLKQCSLPPRDLETCAQDRPGWRATIKSACSKLEDNRRDKISDARARRKASVTTPDDATFQCPHCPRLCASGIGLYSHARTHRQWIPQKRHLRIRWSTDDDDL